ncbi:hypothetical protein P0082_11610 [Candidatus Haliotispira prima]|uniref:Uncharacterized protein n=1 Tax=Candidatus Haliotispira prima TaxID=3034016 RepID=A0ABY8MGL9_9SPIO|nr:hypothetical protein P0082_11610 [Candidatus Haliotispira prima]
MSATDFLQPETAYKVYIFNDKSVIETLPFTTAAIPPASEFPSAGSTTTSSDKFAPNVLPFDAEINYDADKKGAYEFYGKEGEVLLLPMYMKQVIYKGWNFVNALAKFVISCQFTSCLPNRGYASTAEYIYQSIAANTYHKVLFGFQSFKDDEGIGYIRDRDSVTQSSYVISFVVDK